MDLTELIRVLWRRKFVVMAVVAIVIGAAVASLKVLTPTFESSSTLVVRPVGDADFFLFSTIDSIIPVYADAAEARATKAEAEAQLGHPVEEISVDTNEGTPIIEVNARSTDPVRAQENAEAVTGALLARVERGEVGLASLELTVVDPATVPTDPVFPRTELTLLVAGVLGLLLGAGAALLAENLSTRLESVEAIEGAVGLPCYAEIPQEPAISRVVLLDALSSDVRLRRVYEALRDLRTNLRIPEGAFRSVLITSPDGHHGKTTVALGLAVTLAEAGTKTLLVDGDLRHGRIAEVVGLPPSGGLLEALGGAPVRGLARETSVRNLDVLTRGHSVRDPGDILRAFPAVLRQIEEEYDVVVIDTTPLMPINDARVLASFSNTILLVVGADAAHRRHLRAAVGRLELISLRPAAFVLNRAKPRYAGSDYYSTVPERPPSRLRDTASA